MFNFDKGNLPELLCPLFDVIYKHEYHTRYRSKGKIKIPKRNTVKFGINSFSFLGSKTFNEIKDYDFYYECKNINQFKKCLRKKIIDSY